MPIIFDPPFKTLDNGLVLYAPLWAGELSKASFNSKDTNEHLCTVTGALWTPQGRTFDGDDNISASGAALLSRSWTAEIWVKRTYDPDVARITLSRPNDWRWFLSSTYATHYIRWQKDDLTYENTTSISLAKDVWGHIVFTYDDDKIRGYLDGVLQFTTATTTVRDSVTSIRIGDALIGIIGEVRLYNRALTALEIQQIYLSTRWRYQ